MKKILFVTSELYPLIKTGGLADVSYSLPEALVNLGHEVIVAIPGYPAVLKGVGTVIKEIPLAGVAIPTGTTIYLSSLPGSKLKLWIVNCPGLFDRPGGPYQNEVKEDWPDNAYRFASFCRAVVELVIHGNSLGWLPDVVHCNDWQSGLVPALLSLQANRPLTIQTIHNLAYQGNFPEEMLAELYLPQAWWSWDRLEFYGKLSFLKAGIVFADKVTTVSPTYAQEILTPEFGCGMDGLLQYYADKLSGILNGIDYQVWNPEIDPLIHAQYNAETLALKANNKLALQQTLGFKKSKSTLMVGVVSRLVHQKGVDLLAESIPKLIQQKIHWVILGSGSAENEQALLALAKTYPDNVSVTIGYDEALAHRIEAAVDIFAMPSRYEPCGLNQIYSLRYGSLPLVTRTGGLADTVVDATEDAIHAGTATGIVLAEPSTAALCEALLRAVALFRRKKVWKAMQKTAMAQDFSGEKSAEAYLALEEPLTQKTQCLQNMQ